LVVPLVVVAFEVGFEVVLGFEVLGDVEYADDEVE
jgi:hypothetical protein